MKKDLLYLVIQFILFVVYFIFLSGNTSVLHEIVGYVAWFFMILGFVIILLGIINLKDNITVFPSPKNGNKLISSGIYEYIRHPIYSGIILSMFSYAIYIFSILHIIISIAVSIVFYFKSSLEEKYLIEIYEDYEVYKEKTGRFFPRLFRR